MRGERHDVVCPNLRSSIFLQQVIVEDSNLIYDETKTLLVTSRLKALLILRMARQSVEAAGLVPVGLLCLGMLY